MQIEFSHSWNANLCVNMSICSSAVEHSRLFPSSKKSVWTRRVDGLAKRCEQTSHITHPFNFAYTLKIRRNDGSDRYCTLLWSFDGSNGPNMFFMSMLFWDDKNVCLELVNAKEFCTQQAFATLPDGDLDYGNLHLVYRRCVEVLDTRADGSVLSAVSRWLNESGLTFWLIDFRFVTHRYWYRNVLYINNLFDHDELCMNWYEFKYFISYYFTTFILYSPTYH